MLAKKENRTILWVTLSALTIFYSIFLIYPLIYQFIGSFFDWNPLIDKFNFIGIQNYLKLFKAKIFWLSLSNTLFFTLIVLVLRTAMGLGVAVLINNIRILRAFFRSAYFVPVVTSMVAVSLVWKWMYDPSIGVFNAILSSVGLKGLKWLKSSTQVIPSIMITTIWKDMGFVMVIYLAALSNIAMEYYEAAKIDGASTWKIFWHISLPLVKPATVFVLITGTIAYLQTFVQIWIMTGGGPGMSSYTIVYMIYMEAFSKWNFGYASAITQVLFFIIMVISMLQFKYMRSYWEA